ncbi:Hypothetical protein FKW44_023972 [Caligus rogercresseyi]|uniref:Uncharacterized protein n=1 Tax=Caligus rogercresseyi TaxID=217165 RepID=A0A7T8GQI8_CALRO|nr:Hypothetical protein FKW44_023972 [Caligus rogercresseyi]
MFVIQLNRDPTALIIRNSHIIKIPRVEVDQKEILLKEKDVFIMEAFDTLNKSPCSAWGE